MSNPVQIPSPGNGGGDRSPVSPIISPKSPFKHLVPSPIITRRKRTESMSERIDAGPTHHGTMKEFCRERGHGFIQPREGGDPLFCHIQDIEGEFVPHPGDEVSYKTLLSPPKMDKLQAVHVKIDRPVAGVTHERWDAPIQKR